MKKRIVYTDPSGQVCILIPGSHSAFKTEEAFLAWLIEKDVPNGATDVFICNAADIPSDRTFRDAWRCREQKIQVDMTKAQAVQMARIRAARDNHPRWAEIDASRARALETGDTELLQEVNLWAQALRDVPQHSIGPIKRSRTPEELEAVWPAVLGS